jgi:hypothetical protein
MGGIVSGITGAVGDLLGGSQSAPSQPNVQVYQPGGTSSIDQYLQQLLGANTTALSGANNPYTQNSGNIQQLFNSLFNNPNAAGYQQAAGASGAASNTVGNNAVNASGQLNTAALGLLPGAQQVYNLGLDPQNALYNQQFQKTNDQANVANAQYGLTGQQAAGNTQQADTNFNIDWQNNQLSRALAGLQGAGNAVTSASGNAINASNLGTTGASNILAGGSTPYAASTAIGEVQTGALQNYINQLLGPVTSSQSTIGDLSQYLGQGISASEGGASAALGDYNAQQQAQSSLGGGLANILGLTNGGGSNLISSIFGGSGSSGSNPLGLSSGSNFTGSDISSLTNDFNAGTTQLGGSGGFDWSSLAQFLPDLAAFA